MKIESYQVALASQHLAVRRRTVSESLQAWTGQRSQARTPAPPRAQSAVFQPASSHAEKSSKTASGTEDEADIDPRLMLLKRILEQFFGIKINLFSVKDLSLDGSQPPPALPAADSAGTSSQPQSAGYGIAYDRHEENYEAEAAHVAAAGVIKTSDGKEITFKLDVRMAREYARTKDVRLRAGDAVRPAKDPLVINFDGAAAQLTDMKFSFDLDSNGVNENISFVRPGSGFLALDKNNDGQINNGAELFGAASGNGFRDLAQYDSDQNGWIDENDAVYKDLRVWSKDSAGNDQLSALKEKNAGAIFLGSVASPFSVKDSASQLQGAVRSTGVYLTENGAAGSVQQVDLAV